MAGTPCMCSFHHCIESVWKYTIININSQYTFWFAQCFWLWCVSDIQYDINALWTFVGFEELTESHTGTVMSQPSKMSYCTKKSLKTKEKDEKVRTDVTPKSSATSCGVDWKSPEDVHVTGMQRWSFPGGWRGCWRTLHSLPTSPYAWWHLSHGFQDRQLNSRWFNLIGVAYELVCISRYNLYLCLYVSESHQKGGISNFHSEVELGEQTVKDVDNLLGSGVTHVELPVLPVWSWEH